MANRSEFYLPQLDGLRACAFLAVFAYHSTVPLSPLTGSMFHQLERSVARAGCYGVDLFFTLSALLITTLLLRERRDTGSIDVPSFYVRRILRIWPLYFAFLALLALLRASLPTSYYFASALFLGNYVTANLDLRSLGGGAAVILWSIAVEEQFYLCWAPIVSACRRNLIPWCGAILWLSAIAGRWLLMVRGIVGLPMWYQTVAHLDSIGAGVILAVIGIENLKRAPLWLLPLGGALWVLAAWKVPGEFGFDSFSVLMFALIAPGSALMVAGALASYRILNARPVVYLGRISYGLYILHNGIIRLCVGLIGRPAWMLSLVTLALTVVCAAASFHCYERPFLRLKGRFQRVKSGHSGRLDFGMR